MTSAAVAQSTPAQRWLARLSFVLAGMAIVILVVFAGLKSLAVFGVGLAAAVVSVAAIYFFLSRRGIVRWLSLGVFWPGALRVWVPRDRPGIPAPRPAVDWAALRRLASGRREPAEVTA